MLRIRVSKEDGAKKKYTFSRMDRLVQALGTSMTSLWHDC